MNVSQPLGGASAHPQHHRTLWSGRTLSMLLVLLFCLAGALSASAASRSRAPKKPSPPKAPATVSLTAGTVAAARGTTVSVPITLDLPSVTATGVGFSMSVSSNGSHPVTAALGFTSSIVGGTPLLTNPVPTGATATIGVNWNAGGTNFGSHTGTVLLGNLRIAIPAGASAGEVYTCHFTSGSYRSGSDFAITAFTDGSASMPGFTLSLSGTNGEVSVNGTQHALPYSQSFDPNAAVTLSAVETSASWPFADWSGDQTGTDNPVVVTMNGNKNITANFGVPFAVALDPAGAGSGTVSVNSTPVTLPYVGFFALDSVVTLTAAPNAGSVFAGWYKPDGTGISSGATTAWSMTAPRDIRARFMSAPNAKVSGSGYYTDEVGNPDRCTVSINVQKVSGASSGTISWYNAKTRNRFTATSISDISVAAKVATITGTASVNGVPGFTFTLVVTDGTPDRWDLSVSYGGVPSQSTKGNLTSGNVTVLP